MIMIMIKLKMHLNWCSLLCFPPFSLIALLKLVKHEDYSLSFNLLHESLNWIYFTSCHLFSYEEVLFFEALYDFESEQIEGVC